MPNAIRLLPGVVKTELARASCGPAAIVSASSCSVLPLLGGNEASSGVDASLTDVRIPDSSGTFSTGSRGDSVFLSPPPQATTKRDRTTVSRTEKRNIGRARVVGASRN